MAYEFREVICPYCGHQFMLHKSEGGIKIVEYLDKTNGKLCASTICPKCRETVIALDKVLVGVREDDDRIKVQGIRGI